MRRLGVAVAVLALALAGCGDKKKTVTFTDNEGQYLDLGGLRYQVQLSRQLNPYDVEDRAYLQGLPRSVSSLRAGESWFAVFLRVENPSSHPVPAATSFVLKDTQNNRFVPVPIASINPFAYEGGFVQAKDNLPPAQSVAQLNESIGGAEILFKVPVKSYANRPLELTIRDPRDQTRTATVDLDV